MLMRIVVTAIALLLPMSASAQQNPLDIAGGAPAPYPEWLRPGLRLTYLVGASNTPGTSQRLLRGGGIKELFPTGGSGYLQHTINAAEPAVLAVDSRQFISLDAGRNWESAGSSLSTGNSDGLGTIWLPPARLAAMREGETRVSRILRVRYPLFDRAYSAIIIETGTDNAYERRTYDLDTGLLLVFTASSLSRNIWTPNPNGGAPGIGPGTTSLTSHVLYGFRQVNLPWRDIRLPKWVAPGTRMDYAGTYGLVAPGSPPTSSRMSMSITVAKAGVHWATVRQSTSIQGWNGLPNADDAWERVVGPASSLPIWLPPGGVQKLKPSAVLDYDPVTGQRVNFGGTHANIAFVIEEGPLEQTKGAYDMATSALIGLSARRQSRNALGVSELQTELKAVQR